LPFARLAPTKVSTNKKLGMVVYACHPSYARSINRITVYTGPGINMRKIFENSLKQKGLGIWLKW
jgi:hypothetical protein